MPIEALQALAERIPTASPRTWCSARRCAGYNDLDGALKAFERAAELVLMATGDENPHLQIAQIAIERKDLPRAIASLEAVMTHDFDNVDVARELVKLMREAKAADPARLAVCVDERIFITAADLFDGEAHAPYAWAMQRTTGTPRSARLLWWR